MARRLQLLLQERIHVDIRRQWSQVRARRNLLPSGPTSYRE